MQLESAKTRSTPLNDPARVLRWFGWVFTLSAAVLAAFLVWQSLRVDVGFGAVPSWELALAVLLLGGAALLLRRVRAALFATRHQADAITRTSTESEARMQAIVDTAADGIVIIDEKGLIESFNASAQRMFGYDAAEVVGKSVNMLMPSPFQERHDDYIAQHLQTGKSKGIGISREREGKHKNGTIFPVEVAVSEVRLPQKRLFVGIFHDIKERQRTQDALLQSKSFLQSVVDQIPESLMVIDRDYHIVLSNRAFRDFAGEEDPVASCLKCHQVSHHREEPCDGLEHECPLRQVFSDGAPVAYTHAHLNSQGNKVLMETVAGPILDDTGEVVQIIETSRDVTARVRAEEQARQRQVELAHVARVGTMGEMAAGLAHELNQPLSAIINYVQACLERIRAGSGEPDELARYLEAAAAQAQRAGGVVEHIRAFLRKDKATWKKMNLNGVARNALELLGGELRRSGTELRCELADSLPELDAVPIEIEQVVVNLIQNGIEAMLDADADPRKLTIRTRWDRPDHVEFAITDSGPGLPSDSRDRVFETFFTTKRNGLGMGLSICRSIIEAHGGRLRAANDPGGGAMFVFTLPISNGDNRNET
ncbi:MAG: PAS domain S-box protein [Phycisphaerales bacterium]|nr:MAG: PAS domain S-box protein [Phycisphaerales bacterium]